MLVEKLQGAEKEHGLLTNEVQRMDGVRGLEDKLKEKHVQLIIVRQNIKVWTKEVDKKSRKREQQKK